MPPSSPLAERLWPKVAIAGPNDCWEWKASCRSDGYGVIRSGSPNRRSDAAHRASWELKNGPIPDGLFVLHQCDNKLCVNPAHLFLGTQRDNMRDMARKGRNWQQVKTHCAQGHEYSPENTYAEESRRSCRACNRAASARYRARRAA